MAEDASREPFVGKADIRQFPPPKPNPEYDAALAKLGEGLVPPCDVESGEEDGR